MKTCRYNIYASIIANCMPREQNVIIIGESRQFY